MKNVYESRASKTSEGKRIKELENENEKIKNYYTKRIREIEEKNKYGVSKRPPSASQKTKKDDEKPE
jgi:hypothetical protein